MSTEKLITGLNFFTSPFFNTLHDLCDGGLIHIMAEIMDGCKDGTVKTQIILAAFHTDCGFWRRTHEADASQCLLLSQVRVLIYVAYIVLFVGRGPFSTVLILLIGETHGAPFLIGEGLPHNRKAMKVMISISNLIQWGWGENICLVFGLMVAPFHQPNTTCFLLRSGLSTYVGMCLPSRKKKKRSQRKIDIVFLCPRR